MPDLETVEKRAPGKDQTMKKAARRRQSLICCVKLPEAKKTYCVPNLLQKKLKLLPLQSYATKYIGTAHCTNVVWRVI